MIFLTEVNSDIDLPLPFNHGPQSARSSFHLGPGNTHGAGLIVLARIKDYIEFVPSLEHQGLLCLTMLTLPGCPLVLSCSVHRLR